ncbi:MAG: TetR/AcrR family transcriptional regulator [Deltaproteobacteria bacterium]|nr:TetR/AcrR family transcriptional regulator [Deltaproteobacteria bacterium]
MNSQAAAAPPPARPLSHRKRDRILAAAQAVFSRSGYHQANLDDVVRLARVGRATLYREFGSKDALLLAVVTSGIDDLRDRMVAAVSIEGPPREVFGRAIRSALSFFDQHRALARILFLEARELHDEVVKRYFERYESAKPLASALYLESSPLCATRSPGELADVLMYLIAGRVMIWLLKGQPAPLSLDADFLLEVYIRALFGPPPARER